MEIRDYDKNTIESFLRAVEAHDVRHPLAQFRYLSIKSSSEFEIYRGELMLGWEDEFKAPPDFCSATVRAGVLDLNKRGQSVREFINAILTGKIEAQGEMLIFPTEHEKSFSFNFFAFTPGVSRREREKRLSIRGRHFQRNLNSQDLDWDLKASVPPFNDTDDLLRTFGFTPIREHTCLIEIIEHPCVRVGPGTVAETIADL